MGTKVIPGVPDAIGRGSTQGLLQKLLLKKEVLSKVKNQVD